MPSVGNAAGVMTMRVLRSLSIDMVLGGIAKQPLRAVLTALCVAAAFALFGVLQGINDTFDGAVSGLETASRELFVNSRVSRTDPLPVAHLARIDKVAGVEAAVQTASLLGYFQESKNWVGGFAVDVDREFSVFTEFRVDSGTLARARDLRTAAIVGRTLAERYGWKVGDRVPITSFVWATREGSYNWDFDIVGIYDAPDPKAAQAFIVRYDYFDAQRNSQNGTVTSFAVRVASSTEAQAVARRIDAQFANSAGETLTESGREAYFSRIRQLGDVKLMIHATLAATFLLMLFVVANTIRQSSDERIWEFGVLQSLGFNKSEVVGLVALEALALAVTGAVIGIAAAGILITVVPKQFGEFSVPAVTLMKGALTAVAVALVSALPPACRIARLPVVSALRRT